jgi:hypothetical protein
MRSAMVRVKSDPFSGTPEGNQRTPHRMRVVSLVSVVAS